MSWISLSDLTRVYLRCVEDPALSGPLNAVAPEAVTNLEFTRAIGAALRRPTALPLPALAVKLLFGEMGRETLLSDLAVEPARLQAIGFSWEQPYIDQTLQQLLVK